MGVLCLCHGVPLTWRKAVLHWHTTHGGGVRRALAQRTGNGGCIGMRHRHSSALQAPQARADTIQNHVGSAGDLHASTGHTSSVLVLTMVVNK
jgi:hypothetical protein